MIEMLNIIDISKNNEFSALNYSGNIVFAMMSMVCKIMKLVYRVRRERLIYNIITA